MLRELVDEQKAQISIELIIVLAAVVALVIFLATQLKATSAKSAEQLQKKTEEVFSKIEEIS